ncbi:hypothetical protein V5N11_022579 [Cardamine amara subsp. amara]|uniref:Uncharacterized protein n=1 Tax=Cardamine amara subsp. amara TaxID=228776 RepID=A0ABD1A2N2_CARAN
MGWIWSKGISVGKKVLAATCVLSSAPFIVPPLIVALTIALISSLPYCIFLASYVCTEKLMRKLLPPSAFGGKCDHKIILLPNKIGHGDVYYQGMARVAMSEPIFVQTPVIAFEEDEDMEKESKSLLERIRDDRGISENIFKEEDKDSIVSNDTKSKKVGAGVEDLTGLKQVSRTRHEEKVESTTTKASRGKDMGKSSNEVLYNEEQIWEKMEALRKVVGYSIARSTTYSEELKALYVFMGVELPTSMLEKENQDIAKVSERLCFLMSVIGIK